MKYIDINYIMNSKYDIKNCYAAPGDQKAHKSETENLE